MQLEKGMKISCYMNECFVENALVQEEGGIFYICQNVCEGYSCYDKLGFDYSCRVDDGSTRDCEKEHVFGIKLIEDDIPFPECVELKGSDNLKEGMKISCKIGKTFVNNAIVHKEGGIFYLCQNFVCGSECENRMGYKYSWLIGQTSRCDDIARYDVSNIIVLGEYNLNLRLIE